MKRLEDEFSKEGFTVLWVGFQDRADKIRSFAGKLGLVQVGFDPKSVVSRKFGVSYGAGLIFIDREGTVRSRINKGASEEAIRRGIEGIV